MLQYAFRENLASYLVQWKVSFLQESNYIVLVTIASQYFPQTTGGLVISGVLTLYENCMLNAQLCRSCFVIVCLSVNHDQQIVSKAIHLLCRIPKWT